MGGKLSEGINFKDEMARGVIGMHYAAHIWLFSVVGMPYPNKNDPLLKCKLEYLNKAPEKLATPTTTTAPPPTAVPKLASSISSDEYYENLCMNTINQSIGTSSRYCGTLLICFSGRSIRHANDYACIVLCDSRYNRPNVQKKLPKWIAGSISSTPNFGAGNTFTSTSS